MSDQDRLRSKQERELSESIKHFTMEDFQALRDLVLLLEENNEADYSLSTFADLPSSFLAIPVSIPINKFKLKSDLTTNLYIWTFLQSSQ